MSSRLPKILIVLAATGVFAPAAAAEVRYAAPSGLTAGQCLSAATACELNRAVEALPNTTEVIVLPGSYDLGSAPGTSEIEVGPATNVHGQAGTPVPTITAGGAVNSVVRVVQGQSRVADLALLKTGGSGSALFVADGTAVAERIQATSLAGDAFACGLVRGTIRDTVCFTPATGATALGQNQFGAGTYSGTLRNVTAVALGPGSVGIAFRAEANGVNLNFNARNVIASGPAADARVAASAGASSAMTFESSNYATASTGGAGTATITAAGSNGNQTAEPVFVNIANGDLHQAPSSPTIDAGSTDSLIGAMDLDGGPRIAGQAIDIGADEYLLAPPVELGTTPASPADDNAPLVRGEAPGAAEVRVFATPDCSGDPVATGPAADFEDQGIAVTVADNTTTTFRATAIDVAGRSSACSTSSVTYSEVTQGTTPPPPPPPPGAGDTRPPETTIDAGPRKVVRAKRKRVKVTLAFASSEPRSRFECSLDGAPFASCGSPKTYKVGRGRHRFEVRAIDAAGNADRSPATRTWRVKKR